MELLVILVGLVGLMGLMGFFLIRGLLRKRPRDKTNRGDSPLHKAAGKGHADVVTALLATDADPNAKDKSGYTPLHRATRDLHRRRPGEGYTETVTALLAAGADRNAKDIFGRTPLQRAAEGGHTRAAALLE